MMVCRFQDGDDNRPVDALKQSVLLLGKAHPPNPSYEQLREMVRAALSHPHVLKLEIHGEHAYEAMMALFSPILQHAHVIKSDHTLVEFATELAQWMLRAFEKDKSSTQLLIAMRHIVSRLSDPSKAHGRPAFN
jgi:hypothetical protein